MVVDVTDGCLQNTPPLGSTVEVLCLDPAPQTEHLSVYWILLCQLLWQKLPEAPKEERSSHLTLSVEIPGVFWLMGSAALPLSSHKHPQTHRCAPWVGEGKHLRGKRESRSPCFLLFVRKWAYPVVTIPGPLTLFPLLTLLQVSAPQILSLGCILE